MEKPRRALSIAGGVILCTCTIPSAVAYCPTTHDALCSGAPLSVTEAGLSAAQSGDDRALAEGNLAPLDAEVAAWLDAFSAVADLKRSDIAWVGDACAGLALIRGCRSPAPRLRRDAGNVYAPSHPGAASSVNDAGGWSVDRPLSIEQERRQAVRKRSIIVVLAAIAIIVLLLVILLLMWRSRERTRRYSEEIGRQAEEKVKILAHVSHEIRSPLSSIILLTHALGRQPGASVEDQEMLSRMSRSGERVIRLLEDMLTYSRLEAGHVDAKPVEVVIRVLLEDVVATNASVAAARGLSLTLDMAACVPDTILCDGDRLHQVLNNLMANAVRFTDVGHVALRVTRPAPGHHLRFVVEDTGVGIPPDQVGALFEEYRQVHSPHHDRGGTGLGLVISRRIAEAMGGRLTLRPRPSGGSIATLLLPLRQ